jgi:hypothetical protein
MWNLYKLNIYTNTYMIIYLYIHRHSERENKIALVGLSEGTMESERGKENARE